MDIQHQSKECAIKQQTHKKHTELKKNDDAAEQRWFWKIWPLYVKWVCPVIIGVILVRSIL